MTDIYLTLRDTGLVSWFWSKTPVFPSMDIFGTKIALKYVESNGLLMPTDGPTVFRCCSKLEIVHVYIWTFLGVMEGITWSLNYFNNNNNNSINILPLPFPPYVCLVINDSQRCGLKVTRNYCGPYDPETSIPSFLLYLHYLIGLPSFQRAVNPYEAIHSLEHGWCCPLSWEGHHTRA